MSHNEKQMSKTSALDSERSEVTCNDHVEENGIQNILPENSSQVPVKDNLTNNHNASSSLTRENVVKLQVLEKSTHTLF